MPQIPVYRQQTLPQGSASPGQTYSGAVLGGVARLGAAVQGVENAVEDRKEREGAAWATYELTKAQAEWSVHLQERAADADQEGFTPKFLQEFDGYRAKVLAQAPTRQAREYLSNRLLAYRGDLASSSLGIEAKARVARRGAQLDGAVDFAMKSVAERPGDFLVRLAEVREGIRQSGLDPADRVKREEAARVDLAKAAVLTNIRRNPTAVLRQLYAAPGESGEAAVEALTYDAREQMIDEAEKVLTEKTALDKAAAEEAEREATLLLLRGQLNTKKLEQMVASGDLSPKVARTLRNTLKEGSKDSDDGARFRVMTNLLAYDEDDIAVMPGLSWADRETAILKRRDLERGWQGTQAAKEAERRIDRALGILPGTPTATLSEDVLRQRGRALTAWYNAVDELPPNERDAAVIPKAEEVIQTVLVKSNEDAVKRLRDRLEKYKADKDVAKMSKSQRAEYDAEVKRLEDNIAKREAAL